MPNNCLSVLYKHIIQVENKNVGLKVGVCVWGGGGAQTYHCPQGVCVGVGGGGGGGGETQCRVLASWCCLGA